MPFLRIPLLLVLFLLSAMVSRAIPYDFKEEIKWKSIQKFTIEGGAEIQRLSFDGAYYPSLEGLPEFVKTYAIHTTNAQVNGRLENMIFEPLSEKEQDLMKDHNLKEASIIPTCELVISRKQPYVQVSFQPIRWNVATSVFEKLISFDLVIQVEEQPERDEANRERINSVLAEGNWFKVRIDKSGIYKITYQELQEMGFDVSVNPKKVAVFGNGGGILPEINNAFRHNDLVQNPIVLVGEEDGSFDANDYILFYGEGPVTWNYNALAKVFNFQSNYYDDYSYYFITALNEDASRVETIPTPQGSPDMIIDEFIDYQHHELDERNLFNTGRQWFGEVYDFNTTKEFIFNFPNIVEETESGYMSCAFAARSFTPSSFGLYVNNQLEKTLAMEIVYASNFYVLGKTGKTHFFFKPDNDQLVIKTIYNRNSNNSIAYLNYIEINVKRRLLMSGNQMRFRMPVSDTNAQIAKYRLGNATSDLIIWDISNPVQAKKVNGQLTSSTLEFNATATSESLTEYIAFYDNDEHYKTVFVEKVANQNLHALKNIEYLVITHKDFLEEANRLAEYHKTIDNLNSFVTVPELIYNEFSSGSQDITAIRDFVKMLYDNSDPGQEIRYLLLFGDASFDYKDRLTDNTNFVPCWESMESMSIVRSVASDDYYGLLDDGEGVTGKLDIGIGRFIAGNIEQAKMAVDKIIHYTTNTHEVMQPWRNMMTFVADDGNGNTHLNHAEILSNYIYENYPVYNIDKIYLDAYKQIATPGGQVSPDMNKAINDKIEKGTFIFNYSGHGGESGLGDEKFMQIADINSWTNYDKLSLFITATCEFTRYDDPTRVSAGELVFLNKKGGAVALLSTARATYASSNLSLNEAIYHNNLFEKINGDYPCLGDVIRKAKLNGGENDTKFILIGDPAMQLAYTKHKVETIKINNELVIENIPDTLQALARVRVEGIVTDQQGNQLTDFNGLVFPTVYDKFSDIETYGDENPSTTFRVRRNILFNGQASITNGEFVFEFIMPKDISYNFGTGRISYYVRNENEDGAGYYENIIVGGFNEDAEGDEQGPDITLYMNDTTFVPGGKTDQNPDLLAFVFDESGINTTGNGIGHDIVATIDDDFNQSYILNQYYEADMNSFQRGKVNYPISNLEDGPHVLSLRVWDIYNNSSTAYLNFVVVSQNELVVENLLNYPNPFISETNFVFNHNQSGQDLDVKIMIFSMDGRKIKTIETRINPEGYQSTPIKWNGLNDNGATIGKGFYVYRVIVKNEDGATGVDTSKLVFLR
ncbi:MAG: type IX secretion system sortase PorU [Bacteroidetes bacterium]|nr:type IX secretion system sortase PorU [Bacteroidota bacterium]